MMNILVLGFEGNNNTSKILLDNINNSINLDCLYLKNDFIISVNQFKNKIIENNYDIIFAFGQKPNIKSIYLEIYAKDNNEKLKTNYNYNELNNYLKNYYKIKISENAGNYLCNNIYYNGLKYIYENKLNIKMVFLHIPYMKNIDIEYFSKIILIYFNNLQNNI